MRTISLSLAAVLCVTIFTSSQVKAGQFVNSFGFGIQYGGVIGWQGSYLAKNNRFRLALGYAGYTLGYDRYVFPNTSFGGQVFLNQYRTGGALSLNYHFGLERSSGWVLGADLYRGVDTFESLLDVLVDIFDSDGSNDVRFDEEPETGIAISIGYHF